MEVEWKLSSLVRRSGGPGVSHVILTSKYRPLGPWDSSFTLTLRVIKRLMWDPRGPRNITLMMILSDLRLHETVFRKMSFMSQTGRDTSTRIETGVL